MASSFTLALDGARRQMPVEGHSLPPPVERTGPSLREET